MFNSLIRLLKKNQKFFLIIKIFLFAIMGAIVGFMSGLMITTFIPLCCDDNGNCHNCFKIGDLTGYEATSFIGFWFGLIFTPIIYILILLYSKLKNKNNIK
jgi:hypothetical protein